MAQITHMKKKFSDYMYMSTINLTDVRRNAVEMDMKDIMEECWRCDRREQGLHLMYEEALKSDYPEVEATPIVETIHKLKDTHLFWLMCLERHIAVMVLGGANGI